MTLKKEINEIKVRLIKAQNEITRLAIIGYEVGNQEVDDAISSAKSLRIELNMLRNKL